MKLPFIDLAVIILYLIFIVLFGSYFVRKNRTSNDFMVAGSSLPGWVIGLSYFGTYISSNTFIGVVGRAFGTDWNYLVFSLAIPFAIWIGTKYFVPFYRHGGEISAYHHMEKRFGSWARTYSVVCYLLIQFSRIATITFGVALALNGLTGWSMGLIIIVSGVLITIYTLLGGIRAVIWTEVIQSVILFAGAILLLVIILVDIPGGPINAIKIASEHSKFSLGSFELSLSKSTFWVVFLYGLFINVKAFGFDQTYVQRYHTAKSDKDARRSLWFGGLLYVPISVLFFFIGSMLFSYYQTQPALLNDLKEKAGINLEINELSADESSSVNYEYASIKSTSLTIEEVADQALPHFMANKLPAGIAGFIIAAIMAAAMSTLSTCLNSSATILLEDVYKKYVRPKAADSEAMMVLRGGTLFVGIIGTIVALLIIGSESILAVWWQLTGIFAGAMLGLFLLGFVVKKADNVAAGVSVIVGILVIVWISLSSKIHVLPEFLQSPFHTYMSVVIATLSMFLVGLFISSKNFNNDIKL
ncbi:sodium:solute symporter [Sunxiuqinia sp. A32]|uniref:sodium:solute symporter n=1 Tax=Sunxiuqinia sp. A32 TaxID=3461496 RepID=UPI004045BA88